MKVPFRDLLIICWMYQIFQILRYFFKKSLSEETESCSSCLIFSLMSFSCKRKLAAMVMQSGMLGCILSMHYDLFFGCDYNLDGTNIFLFILFLWSSNLFPTFTYF